MPNHRPVVLVACLMLSGVAHADPPGAATPQACCFFDHCENLLPEDCKTAGGSPRPGVCGADTCVGACCTANGCVMTLFIDCALPKGYFQGYGVQCESGICDVPRACCLRSGTCVDLTLFECVAVGGIPYGAGTLCDNQVCYPWGACCLPDGSCMVDVNEFICDGAGGVFQGPGSSCFTANCPQPPQACCLRNGCCVEVIPSVCASLGGFTPGFNIPCSIVGCPIDSCQADQSPTPLGNGVIDIDDLVLVITSWGACDVPCPQTDGCHGDIVNCDCLVNIDDLVAVITSWGPCQ